MEYPEEAKEHLPAVPEAIRRLAWYVRSLWNLAFFVMLSLIDVLLIKLFFTKFTPLIQFLEN